MELLASEPEEVSGVLTSFLRREGRRDVEGEEKGSDSPLAQAGEVHVAGGEGSGKVRRGVGEAGGSVGVAIEDQALLVEAQVAWGGPHGESLAVAKRVPAEGSLSVWAPSRRPLGRLRWNIVSADRLVRRPSMGAVH
jgi:hypothetical protein